MSVNIATADVLKKWTSGKNAALGVDLIQDEIVKSATTLVLNNIDEGATEMVEEAAANASTHSGAFSDGTNLPAYGVGGMLNGTANAQAHEFKPISFALARRVVPSLFANKLVAVQPMTGPVGIAFAKRTVYKDSISSATDQGVEAAWKSVPEYSGYTGGYKGDTYTLTSTDVTTGFAKDSGFVEGQTVQVDDDTTPTQILGDIEGKADRGTQATSGAADFGKAAASNDAEGWILNSNDANTKWPELTTKWDQKTVRAGDRMLAATFSLNVLEDVLAMHNFDLKLDMINTLHQEVVQELDREMLQALKWTAINGDGGDVAANVDITSVSDIRAKTAMVTNAIVYASTVIAGAALRGPGNFVVVSNGVASVLKAANAAFTANTSNVEPGIILSGSESTLIGTLNNSISVYLDQFATNEYALIGYKGPGMTDGGVVFSPYKMNVQYSATSEDNFAPRVGVKSRYAISTSLLSAGSFYRLINFKGINTVTGIDVW